MAVHYTPIVPLGVKMQKIANHGQEKKYQHELVGVNSRLDTIQAAILNAKLPHLDSYADARSKAADFYDQHLGKLNWLEIPARQINSTHVFHQYTIKLKDASDRDKLKEHLASKDIPSMVYYPVALHLQEAFKTTGVAEVDFPEDLCRRVLSLPIHTEMDEKQLNYIVSSIGYLNNMQEYLCTSNSYSR